MVVYTLTVYTGDRVLAGTSNSIYVLLRGTEGASEETQLSGCRYHFQGSVGIIQKKLI